MSNQNSGPPPGWPAPRAACTALARPCPASLRSQGSTRRRAPFPCRPAPRRMIRTPLAQPSRGPSSKAGPTARPRNARPLRRSRRPVWRAATRAPGPYGPGATANYGGPPGAGSAYGQPPQPPSPYGGSPFGAPSGPGAGGPPGFHAGGAPQPPGGGALYPAPIPARPRAKSSGPTLALIGIGAFVLIGGLTTAFFVIRGRGSSEDTAALTPIEAPPAPASVAGDPAPPPPTAATPAATAPQPPAAEPAPPWRPRSRRRKHNPSRRRRPLRLPPRRRPLRLPPRRRPPAPTAGDTLRPPPRRRPCADPFHVLDGPSKDRPARQPLSCPAPPAVPLAAARRVRAEVARARLTGRSR